MAAVAAAAVLSAGVAQAYTVGTFSNGVVVPNVIHNGATDTTAVGLVNGGTTTAPVFWAFFDQDSNHVTDGCFEMTANDYKPFVWSTEAGQGTAGQRGYLVFAEGTGTSCTAAGATVPSAGGKLAAHAFQVNTATQDVAYLPVIDGPLYFKAATALGSLDAYSLIYAGGAAHTVYAADALALPAGGFPAVPASDANFTMRYFLDGGAKTNIVVWSTGNQKKTYTVNIYDDAQNFKSTNLVLAHAELDVVDPSAMVGRPATFTDGFVKWDATGVVDALGNNNGASVFSYSVIDAPAFGAVQTVLGFHQ